MALISSPWAGSALSTRPIDIAQDNDGRPLIVLYVGDYDPSGMWMSERDLPERNQIWRCGRRILREETKHDHKTNG
jgi:hypothetical protein